MHKFVKWLKSLNRGVSVVFDNLENVRTALTLLETHCPEIKWVYGERNPLCEYDNMVRQANGKKIYLEIVFFSNDMTMLYSYDYQSATKRDTFCEQCYWSNYITYKDFLKYFGDDNSYIIINKEVI